MFIYRKREDIKMGFLDTIGSATGLWNSGGAGVGTAAGGVDYAKGLNPTDNQEVIKQYGEQSVQDRAAQQKALEAMQKKAEQGGMTAQDMADQQKVMSQLNQQEAAGRAANKSSMAQRGLTGGGNELAANLAGQQATSQSAALQGAGSAANAQQRALEAMGQTASQAQAMGASDINSANASNQIKNFNYQNQLQKSAALNGANQISVGAEQGNANRGAGFISGIISDKRAKTDIQTLPEGMLDNVKGYTYEYKSPELHGYGKQTGVMAQDLEKSPLGAEMVEEDPESGLKSIDTGKAALGALAGLANIHARLKALEEGKNG